MSSDDLHQRDPDHRGDAVADAPRRELHHIAPTERISPDWWHTPSIAPTATVTVADTDEFQDALDQVARDWPSRNVTAQLLADPNDPDDRHAVVVLLDGFQVGRLGSDRDPRFPAIVAHLGRTQRSVRVRARMIRRPTADGASTRGLLLFAHPECFDAARHVLAGDRLVDVRPGLDALALVADLPQHEPFAVELVERDEQIAVVPADDAGGSAGSRPGVTDPALGTVAHDLATSLRPVLRAAAARSVRPTCLASWSADVTGRPIVRLHLVDRPDLLHDVCGPPATPGFDHIG